MSQILKFILTLITTSLYIGYLVIAQPIVYTTFTNADTIANTQTNFADWQTAWDTTMSIVVTGFTYGFIVVLIFMYVWCFVPEREREGYYEG